MQLHSYPLLLRNVFIVLGGFIIMQGGCVDNQYAAEKLLWHTERKATNIIEQKGEKNLSDADFEKMVALFKKVARAYPLRRQGAKAQFALANIYQAWGKYEEARKELENIIHNFSFVAPIASQAQFSLANTFEMEGNYRKALREYEKVVDLYPLSPIGLETPMYMIRYQKKRDDKRGEERMYRKAIRHYRQIISDYGDTSVAHYVHNYLARAYMEGQEWEEAIKTWEEMLSVDEATPSVTKAFLARAEIYAKKLNDVPKAIQLYEEFLQNYPQSPIVKRATLRLGGLYLKTGDFKKAKAIFSSLIKTSPHDGKLSIDAHFAHIECLKREGKMQEVMKEYRAMQQKYAGSLQILAIPYQLYKYQIERGDIPAAQSALAGAINEYKTQFARLKGKKALYAAKFLFLCYAEQRSWGKALELLQTLTKQYPRDPSYLLSMGFLYQRKLNKPQEAKNIYEEIIRRYPLHDYAVRLSHKQIQSLNEALSKEKVEN